MALEGTVLTVRSVITQEYRIFTIEANFFRAAINVHSDVN